MRRNKTTRRLVCALLGILIVACIFSILMSVNVNAAKKEKIPIPTVRENIYVYDVGNIIDDDIEKQINALLIQLEKQTTAEVAVITVTSLLDMEIEDYSYELANTLGIGKADDDNGVLLLISKTDERVRLEIGSGLEGCLNDSKCGRILDNYFVPYREKDEYSEGTYKTIEAVVSVIAQEYDVTIGEVDDALANQLDQEEKEEQKKTFITIMIVIIFIAILLGCDSFFLDGVILRALLDGLSSSGGSSGGFGGGGFRGGGASR